MHSKVVWPDLNLIDRQFSLCLGLLADPFFPFLAVLYHNDKIAISHLLEGQAGSNEIPVPVKLTEATNCKVKVIVCLPKVLKLAKHSQNFSIQHPEHTVWADTCMKTIQQDTRFNPNDEVLRRKLRWSFVLMAFVHCIWI